MIGHLLFAAGLLVSAVIGFLYFRDLGDISQMVLKVKRENTIRFIRNEYRLLTIGLGGLVLMAVAHFWLGGGAPWLFWTALLILAFLYLFPWIWVHVGLRNQQNTAKYYSIDEAARLISPSSSVLVMENNGVARAYPDSHLMRPHLAGDEEGLGGENVVMTYCAMANLGIGYTPEIEGQDLELEVLAQHGNNLILRDNTTNEPIQHIYGRRERDDRGGPAMKPWPTFRMSFGSFAKAYPEGKVFLNMPSSNPLLRVFDLITETLFASGIARQHNEAAPIMDNMTHEDDRLPTKTYVWGIDMGDDAVCFTREFLVEQGNLVNTEVGGKAIVVALDPAHDSIGAWYRKDGTPISEIDFFGQSDQGPLQRVETLKPGLFWHVWAEFFPHTDINRLPASAD